MRLHVLLYVAMVATTALLANSNAAPEPKGPIQVRKPSSPGSLPWSPGLTTQPQQDLSQKMLRGATTSNTGDFSVQGDGADDEERALNLPRSIAKLLEGNKLPNAVANLLISDKKKMTPANLRAKILQSLPPEQAANLIFAKMPANLPAKLPPKLPSGIKAQVFKIPGASSVTIRAKMAVWLHYRLPPTHVFKKLGLVGKISEDALHKDPNYKYFKAYFYKWVKTQPVF